MGKKAELNQPKGGAQCQWMFADAGSGWGAIGIGGIGTKLAAMNPARWSSKHTMSVTQEALEAAGSDEKERERPIKMKIIDEDKKEEEKEFKNIAEAVAFLHGE